MSRFNLEDYEPVEERLAKFYADHPDGTVQTQLLHHGDGQWIVKAFVWRGPPDGPEHANGHAHEVTGEGMVNKTSALENCETSAIGRALANLGYAPKGQRPSREEMTKVDGSAAVDLSELEGAITVAQDVGLEKDWEALREWASQSPEHCSKAVAKVEQALADAEAGTS